MPFIDFASLRFHTPPGEALPALLIDFCKWAEEFGAQLGDYQLQGSRLCDLYVEDGTRRASSFVGFLSCEDGSHVGWWRPDGASLESAPVVLLGSDGELRAVGLSLGGFLLDWAENRSGVFSLESSEEFERPEAVVPRSRLQAWLAERGVSRSCNAADLQRVTDALKTWFRAWSAERGLVAESQAERRKLARAVQTLVGLPKPDRHPKLVHAVITARQFTLSANYSGEWPIASTPEFEAALREFRELDARELPEAGLWYRVALDLDQRGVLMVKRFYVDEPDPRDLQLDDQGLWEDAARMPRSKYWMPEWLESRISR
jgi:hypothetical protein